MAVARKRTRRKWMEKIKKSEKKLRRRKARHTTKMKTETFYNNNMYAHNVLWMLRILKRLALSLCVCLCVWCLESKFLLAKDSNVLILTHNDSQMEWRFTGTTHLQHSFSHLNWIELNHSFDESKRIRSFPLSHSMKNDNNNNNNQQRQHSQGMESEQWKQKN